MVGGFGGANGEETMPNVMNDASMTTGDEQVDGSEDAVIEERGGVRIEGEPLL